MAGVGVALALKKHEALRNDLLTSFLLVGLVRVELLDLSARGESTATLFSVRYSRCGIDIDLLVSNFAGDE